MRPIPRGAPPFSPIWNKNAIELRAGPSSLLSAGGSWKFTSGILPREISPQVSRWRWLPLKPPEAVQHVRSPPDGQSIPWGFSCLPANQPQGRLCDTWEGSVTACRQAVQAAGVSSGWLTSQRDNWYDLEFLLALSVESASCECGAAHRVSLRELGGSLITELGKRAQAPIVGATSELSRWRRAQGLQRESVAQTLWKFRSAQPREKASRK